MAVQTLVAQLPVEAFNEGIVDGLSRTNEIEAHGMGVRPGVHRTTDELAATIDRDRCRDDARALARRAAREEGIFAGTSTGLNLVGALQLACELGPGRIVATIAVDTGLKYLAGDLYREG